MEVSVIIPVYNAAPFVEKAVRSALMQPEVQEVLVVDDGSTDGSLAILQRLQSEDKRVHLFRHPGGANRGPGASRNLALQHAQYPYLAFLDADDWYVENRFLKAKEVFEQYPDADGTYETVEMHYYSEAARKKFQERYPGFQRFRLIPPEEPGQLFEHLLSHQYGSVSICGLTIKRDLIERYGISFLEESKMWEDVHFYFSAFSAGAFYPGLTDEPVVWRGVHMSNSIYNEALDFRGSLPFQKIWFKKMLREHYQKSTNWNLFKMKLHYNPLVFPVRRIAVLRYPVKALLFCYYLLRYPRLFTRLFLQPT